MTSCCIHLTPAVVTAASDLTKRLLAKDNGAGPYICCQCGVCGDIRYGNFRNHYDGTGHFLCIRLHNPIEMYCFLCKDFQYSEVFDKAIGRVRPAKVKEVVSDGASGTQATAPVAVYTTRKGLCNMGSTCFMGSILQVLVQNPLVLSCRQMQFDTNNCQMMKAAVDAAELEASGDRTGKQAAKLQKIGDSVDSKIAGCSTSGGNNNSNGGSRARLVSAGCIACEFKTLCEQSAGDMPSSFSNSNNNNNNNRMPICATSGPNGSSTIDGMGASAKSVTGFTSSTFSSSSSSSSSSNGCGSGSSYVVPSNMLYSVWNHANYMAGYEQHDAHEFLLAFLSGIEEHLKIQHSPPPTGTDSIIETSGVSKAAPEVVLLDSDVAGVSSSSSSSSSSVSAASVECTASAPQLPSPIPPAEASPKGTGKSTKARGSTPKTKAAVAAAAAAAAAAALTSPSCPKVYDTLAEIFTGKIQSNLTCDCCGNSSSKLEPFLDLSMSVGMLGGGGSIVSGNGGAAAICVGSLIIGGGTRSRSGSVSSTAAAAATASAAVTTTTTASGAKGRSNSIVSVSEKTKTGGKGKGGRSAIERSGSVDSIMTTLSDTNSSVGGPSPSTASDTKSPHCATPTAGIGQPSAGGGGGGGVACSVVSSAGAVAAGGRSSSSSSSGVGGLPSALESPSKRSTGNLSTVSAASVGLASDISSCMYHYTAPERLSDKIFCDKCDSKQNMHKQLSVFTPPPVLILHLKRFDFFRQTKISTRVEFPLQNLDISQFTTAYGKKMAAGGIAGDGGDTAAATSAATVALKGSKSKGGGGGGVGGGNHLPRTTCAAGNNDVDTVLYDLQGLLCHSGSLHQGHYIAYVLQNVTSGAMEPAGKRWLKCDDENITIVSDDEVRTAEAYLLFYMKK